MTVVSRQLASRRQSDTGFSKLRAAGAQYYCTVVASLSDRRSRSHGAMACAFCVFFFYTTRLPSTVDLISCSLLYSVPAFQVVLLPMLASCVLVACIMQLSLIPLGTERNSGYAAELDKSDEHWARRTKLTSTYASRLSEKQIGCPTSASEKRKGGNDHGPALLHMLWNLYASGYGMHTGGSVTYVMND